MIKQLCEVPWRILLLPLEKPEGKKMESNIKKCLKTTFNHGNIDYKIREVSWLTPLLPHEKTFSGEKHWTQNVKKN